eukprot:6831510-Pyramimonas_sp.AAC.1
MNGSERRFGSSGNAEADLLLLHRWKELRREAERLRDSQRAVGLGDSQLASWCAEALRWSGAMGLWDTVGSTAPTAAPFSVSRGSRIRLGLGSPSTRG